jgi:ABC-type Fe2+-enterobactin transport system substrate-binding protein
MTGKAVTIVIDISKYKYVDLDIDEALRFLNEVAKLLGRKTNDIKEVERYIRNFDEFYEYARKKFKDYIALPHKPSDYIKGEAIIDKVKLYTNENGKRIVIVFDRRVPTETIKTALENLEYSVEIKKEF